MVCMNRTLQNKMIENASLIYLQVHDVIVLMNAAFGFLVSTFFFSI